MRDAFPRTGAHGAEAPPEPPAPVPDACLGVWRRTLLETADTRDASSRVLWLQTPRWHADLRLPAGRPDFSGIGSLAECDDTRLARFATRPGAQAAYPSTAK